LPGHPYSFRRRGRLIPELLPRALEIAREARADLIALTGDLVDVPDMIARGDDYYELPRAERLAQAERDYRLLKQLLDASRIAYAVLPGNHDHASTLWKVFPRRNDYWDLPQGYRIVRFTDVEGDQHVPRRLDRERHLLDAMLADAASPPQIHLQHYVISPQLSGGYPYNYLESEHLRATLVDSGKVVLSLSGHYHPGVDLTRHGACHFATGAAFSVFPHTVTIHRIEGDRVTSEPVPVLERPMESGRSAVFLERDGVILEAPSHRTGPQSLCLVAGAAQAIARLRARGWAVVVASNQSAVGLGYVTHQTVELVNDRMCELLADAAGEGAVPDAVLFSSAAGDRAVHPRWADSTDMKPSPSLFEQATQVLDLLHEGAWVVGAGRDDLAAARAFGARSVLVRATTAGATPSAGIHPADWPDLVVCNDLGEAAVRIAMTDGKAFG
jgi:histidinol-phosphate phosphatase family protein